MGSKGKASTSRGKGPAAALSEDIAGIEDSDTFTVALATVQQDITDTLSQKFAEDIQQVEERLDSRLEASFDSLSAALVAKIAEQIRQNLPQQPATSQGGPEQGVEGTAAPVDPPPEGVAGPEPAHLEVPGPLEPAAGAGGAPESTTTPDRPATLLAGAVGTGAADEPPSGLTPLVADFEKVDYLPPLLFSKQIGPGFDVLPHVTSSGKPELFPLETDLTFQSISKNHEKRNVPLHRNEPLLEYYVGYCSNYYLACSLAAIGAALQDGATRTDSAGKVVIERDTFDLLTSAAKTAAAAAGLIRDRIAHIRAKQTRSLDTDITDIVAQTLYSRPVAHLGSDNFSSIHERLVAELDKQIIIQGAKNRAGKKGPGKRPDPKNPDPKNPEDPPKKPAGGKKP